MLKPPTVSPSSRSYRLPLGVAVFFLILASACGIAGAAPSKATGGSLSAHLTKTSFSSSQAGSVKLIYKFSKPSKHFSYLLTFKNGKAWQTVASVKRKGSFSGEKTMTVKRLFAGKPVKVGSYKLKLTCDGGSKTLSFTVTAAVKAAAAPAPSTSPPSTTPTGAAPVNTSLPVISGTPQTLAALHASTGTWTNSPTDFEYQWLSCDSVGNDCVLIPGAYSSDYTITADDLYSTLRVAVLAANSYGYDIAISAQSGVIAPGGPIPENISIPVITGKTIQGETLYASTGNWTNSPTSYEYWWFACDPNNTDDCWWLNDYPDYVYWHTLDIKDVGSVIGVIVIAYTQYGYGLASSDKTSVVLVPGSPPVNTALPVISGIAKQGETLSTSNGAWNNYPTSFGYQWERCSASCSAISGATGDTYVPAAADVSMTIRVSVTATNSYGSATATSSQTGTVTPPEVSFAPHSDFSVGSGPTSVAVGDFNGDGKQDLATANGSSNNVSVLLGNGSGSFGAATNFGAGWTPRSVAVGDFNGDGSQDLATANQSSPAVSVLLGTGTGSFGAATNFTTWGGSWSLAIGDLNSDGKEDLAVTGEYLVNGEYSGVVWVLLGTGTGSFAAVGGSPFSVGWDPRSVAIGDFNGDGKQDLAVANTLSDDVSVLLGTGSGSFGAASNFSVSTGPDSVAIGDFDGDGKQDLVTAGDYVSVLLGTGTGSFGAATNFGVGAYSVTVGDFNGDGKQDLVTANAGSNVSVLLGTGTGSFGTVFDFSAGTRMLSVAVGDFNGDGRQDLAVGSEDNYVSVLLNTTSATP